MKIKTKLSLAVGFLFSLMIVLTLVSVKYIYALSGDTENILVANYQTVDYARQMLNALDQDMRKPRNQQKFTSNLALQQSNITEEGENELTQKLSLDYQNYLTHPGDEIAVLHIRKDLTDIMWLNMQAIKRKSVLAKQTAKQATMMIAVTGSLCFLLAFTLLVNLPSNIANPIQELTKSIQEIAGQNYAQRVHFEKHNEFGDLAHSFNTMAQKLEEYNSSNLATLMMEKKRIETLINNMHDPVIGLDEQKRILFMNEIALQISGLKSVDVIGTFAQDIAIHNDLMRNLIQDLTPVAKNMAKNMAENLSKNTFKDSSSNLLSGLSSGLSPGMSQSMAQETRVNTETKPDATIPLKIYANGKEHYFQKEIIRIEIEPIAENESIHVGDVILLQNITPFKELDVAKTNFIATVSHELKTPISSIALGLQLLQKPQMGVINEKQAELLDGIQGDVSRLLKITSNLLNMSLVETGNIVLSLMPSSAMEMVQYAMSANKMQADHKQIQMHLHEGAYDGNVLADKEKTAWVLTNLVSNAIRYSPEKASIVLSIQVLEHEVEFLVQDSGPGIAKDYQQKIFERYFRIPGSHTQGTGLGLSISKEFIEAQKGRIEVESELGRGSVFRVVLPRG